MLERPPEPASASEADAARVEIVGSKPAPEPTSAPDWKAGYELATLEVLERERDALRSQLAKHSEPILQDRLKQGLKELVSTEKKYSPTPEDEAAIYSVQMVSGEGTYRTALPRLDYPELYAIKDQILWLDQRIKKKQIEEFLSRPAPH